MWNNFAERFTKIWQNKTNSSESQNSNDALNINNDLNPIKIKNYLRENPDFLEKYVMEEVDLDQVERWMIRRTQRAQKSAQNSGDNTRKTSLSRWKFCVHADKRQMLQNLTHSLQLRPTKAGVLWELANCISSAVNAEGFNLFIAENGNPEILKHYTDYICDDKTNLDNNQIDLTIPIYVAKTREPVRISKGHQDARFPERFTVDNKINHILCQAVVQPDGPLIAVVELYRYEDESPFHEEDEEISCSYLVWGGIALHYAHLFLNMNKQKKLNDFLLAVVKSIFQDMVSMDMLVMKIMNFAQRLVDADRASLFLVDARTKELYATIFDVGLNLNDNMNQIGADDKKQNEIRFPIGMGIAGQVAMTGEVLNILDVYSDPRFNRSVDKKTGYKTESILCMPIFIRGSVIGVVQMVNKKTGCFNKEDEEAFEMFAVYCGLALHHAKLYDKIQRSEQKYRVALEVLSYHNTSTENEVEKMLNDGIPEFIPGIDNYSFNPLEHTDFEKAKFATFMFIDLFGLRKFDETSLIKFILTVKKNYRRVPYHNWSHGFSVANTMYSIMKKAPNVFRPLESLALFIGSLCHDLDHRGKNNKFMLDTESPLAAIYSTSTMEHHHFNQTVTILQQEGLNIFAKLTNDEYKQVLRLIKHCILATDLALFFPNRAKVSELIEQKKFSWNVTEHRMLIQAIAMTASDLSASAKPWEIQEKTVKVIFEEFYEQGDAERSAGRTPIPMMDRNQPEQQASSQVGFINGISIPCYSLLYRLIPETKPLIDMCQENLNKWQTISSKNDS